MQWVNSQQFKKQRKAWMIRAIDRGFPLPIASNGSVALIFFQDLASVQRYETAFSSIKAVFYQIPKCLSSKNLRILTSFFEACAWMRNQSKNADGCRAYIAVSTGRPCVAGVFGLPYTPSAWNAAIGRKRRSATARPQRALFSRIDRTEVLTRAMKGMVRKSEAGTQAICSFT